MERKELIRTIYLYLFSLVGLVIVVIGLVQLVDLGLKAYIFTKADVIITYPQAPMIKSVTGEPTTLSSEELSAYNRSQEEAQQKQKESERARTASNSLALLIVGVPLFLYHWKMIQRDKQSH